MTRPESILAFDVLLLQSERCHHAPSLKSAPLKNRITISIGKTQTMLVKARDKDSYQLHQEAKKRPSSRSL